MTLSSNTFPMMDPIIVDGHDEQDLISSHSLLLTSSLNTTGGCSSQCIADKSKTSQPVFTHNEFYSPPDIKMTLSTAYTSPHVSSLLTPLDLKHHHYPPYVYNDCPNGWESDDDIINNDTLTTDIASDNSQSYIFFDNNSTPPTLISFLPYSLLL